MKQFLKVKVPGTHRSHSATLHSPISNSPTLKLRKLVMCPVFILSLQQAMELCETPISPLKEQGANREGFPLRSLEGSASAAGRLLLQSELAGPRHSWLSPLIWETHPFLKEKRPTIGLGCRGAHHPTVMLTCEYVESCFSSWQRTLGHSFLQEFRFSSQGVCSFHFHRCSLPVYLPGSPVQMINPIRFTKSNAGESSGDSEGTQKWRLLLEEEGKYILHLER